MLPTADDTPHRAEPDPTLPPLASRLAGPTGTDTELRLAAALFDASSQGMVVTDSATTILRVNGAFEQITGWPAAELVGRTPRVLASGRQSTEFYRAMWQALAEQGRWRGELVNRRRDGSLYTEQLTIHAVLDAAGRVAHYVGVISDISERRRSAERIAYLGHHDALTGLPNRLLLRDRLRMAIEAARRRDGAFAVLCLDLDRFKGVNDTLGHVVGDLLLEQAAARLKRAVREADTVCRQGGDEFIVLLSELGGVHEAETAALRILDDLRAPYVIGPHAPTLSASIGVAVFPRDGTDTDTLLKHADVAMYEAKRCGRDLVRFHDARLSAQALRRATVEAELRVALERREFFVELQPLVRPHDRTLAGAEALVRWAHPSDGVVAPGGFIEVAQDSGLIVELERQVLRLACGAWRRIAARRRGGRVAVNVSPPHFAQPDFPGYVAQVLHETGLQAASLELEVTEGTLMADTERVLATLDALHDMGVSLAIDDFGTGYSSLSYLQRLPVRKLKIDRSFVQHLEGSERSAAICRAVIGLGHSLGMDVVAEGVETEAQASALQRLGCSLGQGFLYARPMAVDAFERRYAAGADARRASSLQHRHA